jgi:hypothetical protein
LGDGAAAFFRASVKALRRAPVEAAALVQAFGVVCDKPFVEHLQHLIYGLEQSAATLDAEVLFKHRAVQSLDDALRLWWTHHGG